MTQFYDLGTIAHPTSSFLFLLSAVFICFAFIFIYMSDSDLLQGKKCKVRPHGHANIFLTVFSTLLHFLENNYFMFKTMWIDCRLNQNKSYTRFEIVFKLLRYNEHIKYDCSKFYLGSY